MDAFFASVEIVENPSLRGKPVIVGGSKDHRGVVSTCSYEARRYGVHSAMPTATAYRLCPKGIFIEGNYSLYRAYSDRVFNILYQHTPFVEAMSIDEAYLDVSELLSDDVTPKSLSIAIQSQIFEETKLTCSIGIGTNKLISKVAVSKAKPNGIFEVFPGTEKPFLSSLSIQSLPGVGVKTQRILNQEGFTTIGDLQALSLDALIARYGTWMYPYYLAAQGEDNRPVCWQDQPPKSIGAETTFDKDLSDVAHIQQELEHLIAKTYKRLKAHKMRTKRLSLKLRYSDFKTVTRSCTLISHTNDLLAIQPAAIALFQNNYGGDPPLRLIGISFEHLSDSYWQPLLF